MYPILSSRSFGFVGPRFGLGPGIRPLRLAYFEACQDLFDDFYCPIVPDGFIEVGWGKRGRYERLRQQTERRRGPGR